jgi:hypothetical protein
LSRCLVEPRNSLLASDWRCGSAGRNAVVGVDSRAAGAIQHKARQGRAVTQTGDAVRKRERLREACRPRVLTGACSGDGRRQLRETERRSSLLRKSERASKQAGRQIDSGETAGSRSAERGGERSRIGAGSLTHTRSGRAALLLLCSRKQPRLALGARVSMRSCDWRCAKESEGERRGRAARMHAEGQRERAR